MCEVKVFVTLRESILDPAGTAVKGSLHKLGFGEVADVRIGKYIVLKLEDCENAEERVREMCEKLLANTVMEDFRFEIREIEGGGRQ
ncbi:MAG: phosphoribosylformylglycinamidine synthase subunit PurS [Treponema sp.]|nr:phosphoribosylformylglycinamidine synthase subunit PurS [Treponema sp.]